VTGRDEAQARSLFQVRYRTTPSLLTRQIEQRVIGGDWGANGFTTMAQADTLAHELHLSAADRLLDLGTGRGWPGLYLAAQTGCRVVLTDLRRHPHRRAVLTAGQALRAESLQTAPATRRTHRLLHRGREPTARS
jgi:predicted O-methyltransferase YrrM